MKSSQKLKWHVSSIIVHFWKSRYGHVRFRLMDINCLAYMALVGFLLLFFHKAVGNWPLFALIHFAWIVAILEIVRLGEKHPERKILIFLRTFYSIAVLLYGWRELDAVLPIFYGSYWGTDKVIQWDKFIFGVHPTIWFQQFYRPWLDELVSFFYTGYYTFFAVIPLYFFIRKKRQETFAVLSFVTFSYLSNYILFFLIPVLSPEAAPLFQSFETKNPTGYFLAKLNRMLQASGSSLGASFPSSHVSGALVWVLAAWRYSKSLGYLFAPIAAGIGGATVYLGLHHVLDSVTGYTWGIICYFLALFLIKNRGEDPQSIPGNPF